MPRCPLEHQNTTTHLVNVSFVIDIVFRLFANERLFKRSVADNGQFFLGSIHTRIGGEDFVVGTKNFSVK